jgi:transcriptional regulator with XRE-family HTH domain
MIDHSIMEAPPIGLRIRAVRQRAGMSLAAFAKSIGYSRRALINWEQNVADPTIGVLARLRQLYNVDPEWVLLGDDLRPRSRYGPMDWDRLDRLLADVDQACNDASIDLPHDVRAELARNQFELPAENENEDRLRMRRTLEAIGKSGLFTQSKRAFSIEEAQDAQDCTQSRALGT